MLERERERERERESEIVDTLLIRLCAAQDLATKKDDDDDLAFSRFEKKLIKES